MAVTTRTTGILTPQVGRTISTELGVSGFQIAMGVFGGLAALVAARQLQTVERELHMGELAVPVLVGGVGVVISAMLLPNT